MSHSSDHNSMYVHIIYTSVFRVMMELMVRMVSLAPQESKDH